MTELADEAALALRRTRAELAGVGLAPPLARIYGQHVRLAAGQRPLPTWTSQEFEQRFADVVQLLDLASEERLAGGEWRVPYKRSGEILEWLSHPELNEAHLPLELLSAACYQLAGYPARADTLVRRANNAGDNAPLLALLLRSDFPTLLEEACEAAWLAPTGATDDFPMSPSVWYGLIAGQVASALGVLAADFRWGDQRRLGRALSKLRAGANVLRSVGDPFAWLLVKLTAEVAREMTETSLRPYLRQLSADLSHSGRLAFEGYARQRFVDGGMLAWPSQIRGLDRLALGHSFALCTPTGSGKTTVAEVALLRGLFAPREVDDFAPLCLYIVPTRALAAEVESKLGRALRVAGIGRPIVVTGLYGGTDWGPSDAWLLADEPTVLICTQEKAEALFRFFGGVFSLRLSLVIIDEAHEITELRADHDLVTGESRALRLEGLVMRLKAQLGERCQFIAMSAVAENLDRALAQWMMSDSGAQPVLSEYRSTRQVVGRLVCAGGRTRIVHDVLDGTALRVTGRRNPEAYVPQPFPPQPPAPDFDGPERILAPYALWAASHLAAGEDGQAVLVSITSGVRNWATWFDTLLGEWHTDLPPFFEPPADAEDRDVWIGALDAIEDYFGPDSRERALLQRGVIVHYGRMPGRLPRLLVELIERRVVRVVLATSGLSQGVNLPFETVLVPKLRRHDGRMPRREFWNLAGRAGRPGVSTEGRMLVLERPDAQRWQRERFVTDYTALIQPSRNGGGTEVLSPVARLLSLIRSRLNPPSEEAFIEWLEATAPTDLPEVSGDAVEALDSLDGLLVAALSEHPAGSPLAVEDWLRTTWRASFAAVASAEEARLEDAFIRRGVAIRERIYPDDDARRTMYFTSLPPRDAARVAEIAGALATHFEQAWDYHAWPSGRRLQFVVSAVEVLAEHPRFRPPVHVGTSRTRTWQQVMAWWLAKEEAETQPTQAQVAPWYDFIATHFSYRFNWALSGVLAAIQTARDSTGLPSFTPEDWASTELPWIALWLKDLIEWGTLEPVAAFVLARGGARTRPEAESIASEYYAQLDPDTDDPLAPDAVRQWTIARRGATTAIGGATPPPAAFAAELAVDPPSTATHTTWRVIPSVDEHSVRWLDPSGRELARTRNDGWRRSWSRDFDFRLDLSQRQVVTERY